MSRHVGLLHLWRVEPPLPGQGDHPDQHLRIQGRGPGVELPPLELGGEDVLDLRGHFGHQAGQRAGRLPGRAVAHQDAEAVSRALDVVEQGHGTPLEGLAASGVGRQGTRDGAEEGSDLAVHHHGIQALLAAEVLVDHGFGDAGARSDLLDGGALEPLVGEQLPPDDDELLTPLLAGHARAAGCRLLLSGLSHTRHHALPCGCRDRRACWLVLRQSFTGTIPGWSAGRARLTLNQDKRRRFDSYPGSQNRRSAAWAVGSGLLIGPVCQRVR